MLYSHPEEKNCKAKPLTEHLLNVAQRVKEKIQNMDLNLSIISKNDLINLSYLIGVFHDFGKSTTWFQDYIQSYKGRSKLTNHSYLSALVAHFFISTEISDKQELWAFIAFKIIKKHHGDLESFYNEPDEEKMESEGELNILNKQLQNIIKNNFVELEQFYSKYLSSPFDIKQINFENFFNIIGDSECYIDNYFDSQEDRIELFFVMNLLFSLLIEADKHDAARLDSNFFKGNIEELNVNPFPYIEFKRKTAPDRFSKEIPINKIRNDFLDEIVNNADINPKNHFYTISAPTGIGKTFGCLAFADKLQKQINNNTTRIIYCLPYTSIIDQNFDEFSTIIAHNLKEKFTKNPSKYILKHHHLSSKRIRDIDDNEYYDYQTYLEDKLFVESWESSLIVTTFVQFFHTIIGYKNRMLKKLNSIVNSIVILDEVQNVNPEYYPLLSEVFHILGKRFNIYFLLITATQPKIFKHHNINIINLLDEKKYMTNQLFNRVKLSINQEEMTVGEYYQSFINSFDDANCLITVNNKKTAVELFLKIKNYYQSKYDIYCLTTNLIPLHRKERIRQIKTALSENKRIIVISTQLIEAGVDISFKNVVRDIGPIDSIIQVAGRCNRHGEYGKGNMDVILLKQESGRRDCSIYGSYLIAQSLNVLTASTYESKDFYAMSENYFNSMDFKIESKKILKAIKSLNYDTPFQDEKPVKSFKLLDSYEEHILYVLCNKAIQKKMDKFNNLKEEKNKGILDSKKRLEIETIKQELDQYKLALPFYDYDKIKGQPTVNSSHRYYSYVSFDHHKEYYDSDIGYMHNPLENIIF